MARKKIIINIICLSAIFLWLFFVGQIDGTSSIRGDINLIDEGQFGAWVNHMLHGKIPYKDFFPPYGPLSVYPVYFLVKIFGPSFFVIRLYMTTVGVFLGICIAYFAFKILNVNRLLILISMMFFILYPGVHIRWWIGVFCIIFFVDSYSKKSNKGIFMTGTVLAYALLQSVEIGIFSIFITSLYIIGRLCKRAKIQKDLKRLLVLLSGFLAVIIPFSIFAIHGGWFFDYLLSTSTFILSVSGVNLPNGQGLPNPMSYFMTPVSMISIIKFLVSKNMLFYWSLTLLLIFQTIIYIRFILRKATKNDVMVLLLTFYVLISYFSIIGRSGHHFFYTPFVVLFAAYFLSLIPFSKKRSELFLIVFMYSLFILYIIRYLIIFRFTPFFDFKSKRVSNIERVHPISISQSQANDILTLQKFISQTTNLNDTIFLLNNQPGLYFFVNRANATMYDFPLLAISKTDRLKLVSMLIKNNPIYIIEDEKAWAVDDIDDRTRLPEVVKYMDKAYILYKRVDHYLIYKKKH